MKASCQYEQQIPGGSCHSEHTTMHYDWSDLPYYLQLATAPYVFHSFTISVAFLE